MEILGFYKCLITQKYVYYTYTANLEEYAHLLVHIGRKSNNYYL